MTIPRRGETVRPGIRYGLRAGAYALIRRGNRVLLTHQAGTGAGDPGEWQLPGGGIDPGEGALRALHREVREETGWRIGRPVRIGAYRRFVWMPDYGRWAEKVCHVYAARPGRRIGPPTEPGHSAAWIPLARAVALVADAGSRAILARERPARSAIPDARPTPARRAAFVRSGPPRA